MVWEIPELLEHYVKTRRSKHILNADVKGALDRLGVEYRIVDRYARVDVSEMFEESSEEGNRLLEFFTSRPNFRKSASPGLVERTVAFFKEIAEEAKARDKNEDDVLYIDEYWQMLIISKD